MASAFASVFLPYSTERTSATLAVSSQPEQFPPPRLAQLTTRQLVSAGSLAMQDHHPILAHTICIIMLELFVSSRPLRV